jgi:hypothetical protein
MTTTRLVASSGFAGWQPKTKITRQGGRKTKTTIEFSFGSARSGVLVMLALSLAVFFYLYSVNGSAVKGFQARQAEKEMSELQKQNDQLRIKEAELQSLYYIEESSKKLNMADLQKVSYVEQKGPMALKR